MPAVYPHVASMLDEIHTIFNSKDGEHLEVTCADFNTPRVKSPNSRRIDNSHRRLTVLKYMCAQIQWQLKHSRFWDMRSAQIFHITLTLLFLSLAKSVLYFHAQRLMIQIFDVPHGSWQSHIGIPNHNTTNDDVIKWKHFPRYWPFVRGIHRSPVISPHKGQWRGALIFSLICVWANGWVNNREAGDLTRYRAHYDVTTMITYSAMSMEHHKDDLWQIHMDTEDIF